MRFAVKLILVSVLAFALVATLGRLLTGRLPPGRVLAGGTAGLVLTLLALDAAIGW